MEPERDPRSPDPLLVILSLHEQLVAQQAQHEREREADRRQIARLVSMVEGLTRQLDELLGQRADENRAELTRLRAEAAAARAAADALPPGGSDESASPTGKAAGSKRHQHGRAAKPPGVPRDPVTLRPTACTKCGGARLGDGPRTEPIEEWDYVRAHLRVRSTERVGCTCEDCGAVMPPPPAPPMPLDRASCTFAMVAWLCYSRCGLFIPLDRMVREFAGAGASIPSATATRWWTRGTDLLLPIWGALRLSLLADTHMGMDGTGLQVVFPRVKGTPSKGPIRPGEVDANGYLPARGPLDGQILVFGNAGHAVYTFTPTRHGHHALDFLTVGQDDEGHPIRWRGTITADALTAQDCLFEGTSRTESGCNAHGLRKFRDDADKAPLLASRAMAFIGRIYDVERDARVEGLRGPPLLARRQSLAKPVVDEFRGWLDANIVDLLPKNPIRKAMQYYLNHWKALTLFLTDADVALDNNWSERALKLVALLRNNSMYAGGEEGAVRLCTVFSLVHTCRLIDVDACAYLEWALTRLVPHPDNRGFAPSDLLPAAYKDWLIQAKRKAAAADTS